LSDLLVTFASIIDGEPDKALYASLNESNEDARLNGSPKAAAPFSKEN
jgi:hypothetical protein